MAGTSNWDRVFEFDPWLYYLLKKEASMVEEPKPLSNGLCESYTRCLETMKITLETSDYTIQYLKGVAEKLHLDLGFCDAFFVPTFCEGECKHCLFKETMEKMIEIRRDSVYYEGEDSRRSPYYVEE